MYQDLPRTNQTADLMRNELIQAMGIKIELFKSNAFSYDMMATFPKVDGLTIDSIDIGKDVYVKFSQENQTSPLPNEACFGLITGAFIRYIISILPTLVQNGLDKRTALILSTNLYLCQLMINFEIYEANKIIMRI